MMVTEVLANLKHTISKTKKNVMAFKKRLNKCLVIGAFAQSRIIAGMTGCQFCYYPVGQNQGLLPA